MKKHIALLLAVMMVFAMFSSYGSSQASAAEADEAAPAAGGEVTVAVSHDPESLSPLDCMSGSKQYINRYFYESLFDGDGGNYLPVMCDGYEVKDDTHWDVTIFDYIYDSAGNHITADDVVFSYNLHVDGGYAVRYDDYAGIEKIDEFTVEFTWNHAVNGINALEHIFCHTPIISQASYEASSDNMATDPVGTGPYVLSSMTSGSEYVLTARDDYWQKDESKRLPGHHSYIDTITVKVIPEEAQRVMALENGTILWASDLSNDSMDNMMDNSAVKVEESMRGTNMDVLVGNMSGNSIWSDLNFRLAVFYALDNNAIAAGANMNPLQCFCTPNMGEYFEKWSVMDNYITTYDVDKAKEYLSKTDYNGEELHILTSTDATSVNAAQVISGMLKEVGINLVIDSFEPSMANSKMNDPTAYDLALNGGNGQTVVSSWNRLMDNADWADGNAIGFNADEKMINMFKEYNTLDGYTYENCTELMQYVVDNAYILPYAYKVDRVAYSSQLAGLSTFPDNWVSFSDFQFAE